MARLETIKALWAASATVGIPAEPVTGTAYRKDPLEAADLTPGFKYNEPLDSGLFNQALFELYSVVQSCEKFGVAEYSAETDYPVGALCTRTDGSTMKAVAANGPGTAVVNPDTPANIPGTWAFVEGPRPGYTPPIDETGTSRIFSLSDCGQIIRTTNAAAVAINIPTNASVAIPVGTIIIVRQSGAGLVTSTGAAGVTVNGVLAGAVSHSTQYGDVMFHKVGTDEWEAIGAIA